MAKYVNLGSLNPVRLNLHLKSDMNPLMNKTQLLSSRMPTFSDIRKKLLIRTAMLIGKSVQTTTRMYEIRNTTCDSHRTLQFDEIPNIIILANAPAHSLLSRMKTSTRRVKHGNILGSIKELE